MKYTKGQKIYKYRIAGSGERVVYKGAINHSLYPTIKYALHLGFLKSENDAPRGGKLGDYFLVVKDFDTEIVELKRRHEKEAKDELNASVLPNRITDVFTIVSDNGKFVIDGVEYLNFFGNGESRAEICECDFTEFQNVKFLTRRQVFQPNDPITIVKFDAPKTIEVKLCDCDDKLGSRKIENACGFCIWERKLKIFVDKKRG